MAAICDSCGTDKHVFRAFVTLWNGKVFDLCRVCLDPLAKIIDGIGLTAAQRDQQPPANVPAPPPS